MKLRKEIGGTESARQLIEQAVARVRELPEETLYEPWTSWRDISPEPFEPVPASGPRDERSR